MTLRNMLWPFACNGCGTVKLVEDTLWPCAACGGFEFRQVLGTDFRNWQMGPETVDALDASTDSTTGEAD